MAPRAKRDIEDASRSVCSRRDIAPVAKRALAGSHRTATDRSTETLRSTSCQTSNISFAGLRSAIPPGRSHGGASTGIGLLTDQSIKLIPRLSLGSEPYTAY